MKEYIFNIFKTIKAENLEESIEILLSEPIKMGDIKNFYRIKLEETCFPRNIKM